MTLEKTTRISVWSGPRNISTALMYSFAQQADTRVVDEPLYGYYLAHHKAREYHPGADEVIADMGSSLDRAVNEVMLGPCDRSVLFLKNMTHHLVNMEWGFLGQLQNVLLTRAPRDMLPSFAKNVPGVTLHDTGYADHIKLLHYLRDLGQDPPVLESQEVLKNPQSVLSQLCARLSIPFDEAMLQWEAGPRPEDGVWAKYWYANVHKSTGFQKYQPKDEPFPEYLEPLLAECMPYYEELTALAIRAE